MADASTQRAREFDAFERRLRELERRVAALERAAPSTAEPVDEPAAIVTAGAGVQIAATPAGVAAVLGRALLAIAGAYLLRAFTEWAVLPRRAGVAAGLIYAGYWLFSSARLPAGDNFGIAVRALTAAAIIAPMLWETTVRFAAVPSHGAAAVLVGFAGLALVVTWRRSIGSITRITTGAVVATSIALIIGTHDITPFAIAALAMVALVEYAAVRNHWLDVRWIVAAGADLTIALLHYLLNRPHGLPEGYAAIPAALEIAAPAALAAIYIASTVARTLVHGENMCWFEAGQVTISLWLFLTAALGAHGGGAGPLAAGLLCATLGAACYVAVYLFFDRRAGHDRSFYAYANFALALTISAALILLSGIMLAVTLGVFALGAIVMGERSRRTTLRVHGTVYLLAAAVASGLIVRAGERLLSHGDPPWTHVAADSVAVLIAATACYAAMTVRRSAGDHWIARAMHVLVALVLCWSATGLIAGGAIGLMPVAPGGADHSMIASTRTVIACLGLIVIAWAAGRYMLEELSWIVYPCIAVIGVKLLIEDVYFGRPGAISASLLAYAAALILAPKFARPVTATRRRTDIAGASRGMRQP